VIELEHMFPDIHELMNTIEVIYLQIINDPLSLKQTWLQIPHKVLTILKLNLYLGVVF